MYYLYILKCADDTLYTGITTDLERRVDEHNTSNLGARYTSARRPVWLVYSKKFKDRSTASKEEARIKKLKKIDKVKLITSLAKRTVERYDFAKSKLELIKMKTFREKVLEIVSKIPKGGMMTYKQVATKAGSAGASRAVGSILKMNYDKNIPCHRVIRSDGLTGEYNRGRENKIKLLKKEGAIK